MKKKIISILFCMLLIATIVPTVLSEKESKSYSSTSGSDRIETQGDWNELMKLRADDGAAGDGFGDSVSLDGNTILIGAPGNDDNGDMSGSAYVFTRSGTTWTQQAKLLASDGAAEASFGWSVSLDGDTALIGARLDDNNGWESGSAYIFIRSVTTWTQQAKLLASDGASGDEFGVSVNLKGDTALIGASLDDDNGVDSGSAFVFTRSGTNWTQQAKLLTTDGVAGDEFGWSVSLDGDTALIGAVFNHDNRTTFGSAYMFTRSGTTWTQQTKLLAADSDPGDYFSSSISLVGDTALIGAPGDDSLKGSAYVFTRTGTTWTQQAKLLAKDGSAPDTFGNSVSLYGDTALIGAPYDNDNGAESGSVYVFTRSGTTWTQQAKFLASDGASYDNFGNSISLNGDTVLIGASLDDDNGENSGSAYIFTKGGTGGLEIDITGGFGINAVITNTNETVNVTNVEWKLNVKGGILGMIDITINGTFDVIESGKSKTLGTGLFIGLGPMVITMRVKDAETVVNGIQFLIYSIVK